MREHSQFKFRTLVKPYPPIKATIADLKLALERAKRNSSRLKKKVANNKEIRASFDNWDLIVERYTERLRFLYRKGIDFTDIPGFPGHQASRCGQILRVDYGILRGSFDKDGYRSVSIKGIKRKVHRLVAITFIQNPENKPQVNHINFNKSYNKVGNLAWATSKEDAEHKVAANRQFKGKRLIK